MEYQEPVVSKKRSPIWIFSKAIFALLALFILLIITYSYLINPCSVPISYAIGNIDPRFKISQTQLRDIVDESASRWNKQLGEKIYTYNPNANLKINLVYDDRQAKLDATKIKIAEFDSTSTSTEQFRAKVENLSNQYQKDLQDYNNRVAYWNTRGGAPEATYNQLNNERTALEKRRLDINKMASLLNAQISENNSNINDFNTQLEQDKGKIITTGEYFADGSKINIYTFGDEQELRLVLMHELGHAMSKDHDSQPQSILYPVLEKQDLANPIPSSEDINMVSKKCNLKSSYSFDIPLFDNIKNSLKRLVSSSIS